MAKFGSQFGIKFMKTFIINKENLKFNAYQIQHRVCYQVGDQIENRVCDRIYGQVWNRVRDQVSNQIYWQIIDRIHENIINK
jgi:hypothetical protein